MNNISTTPRNIHLINQATDVQLTQNYQSTQVLNEFRLFYQPPDDKNFYHITCKMILQDYTQNSESIVSWEDDYDYEFTYQQSSNVIYRVTCKLLSHSLVVNILNKEIYDKDFDVHDLKRKYILAWDQKYNLELSLKKSLPFVQDRILKRFVFFP